MYITYCRNQKTVDLVDKTNYRLDATCGDYRPTWLIRVSDWIRVPDTEAVDGYHTISYCWEQSGEVVKNETDDGYRIVDNDYHCIIDRYNLHEDDIYDWKSENDDEVENLQDNNEVNEEYGYQYDYENDSIENDGADEEEDRHDIESNDNQEADSENGYEDPFRANDSEANEQEEPNDCTRGISWGDPKTDSIRIRYVTYDHLLQQVCKGFQVEYVWYDKVCIDQSDSKAKSREIKQMHKIYRNAYYTIAIIPEVCLYDSEDFKQDSFGHGNKAQNEVIEDIWTSSWFKRSWTLEEVMMTRRILIVGTDTNMFQHSIKTTDIPTTLDFLSVGLLDSGGTEQNRGTVNQALAYAHFRTSTKPHDMIYALKNTFYYMFDDIEVDYSKDIKKAFDDFYRHIAVDDLSILCFGSNKNLAGIERGENTMGSYNLPSWTGVSGRHIDCRVIATTHPQLRYYINSTMSMNITTKQYWKISVAPYDRGCYSLSKISLDDNSSYLDKIDSISNARCNKELTDMTTADKNTVLLEWFVNMRNTTGRYTTHYHQPQGGLLTQIRPLTLTEDCEECTILPILLEIQTPRIEPVNGDMSNSTIEGYGKSYSFPAFRECAKSSGRYRAVGLYYLGYNGEKYEPTFEWNHSIGRDDLYTDDPKAMLGFLFEKDDHDVPKEFIIE